MSEDDYEQRLEQLKEKAKQGFSKDPTVIVAYVFGSVARREVSQRSDMDLAVYLAPSLDNDQRLQKRLDLIGQLQGPWRSSPFVDLVVLNDAPLFLKFNVIREGEILVCQNEWTRIHFEARVMSQFYDEQYYFGRHADLAIARIAREGIL